MHTSVVNESSKMTDTNVLAQIMNDIKNLFCTILCILVVVTIVISITLFRLTTEVTRFPTGIVEQLFDAFVQAYKTDNQ